MAHKTIVGKNLIEMLMFNIYSDNMVIYREYIQNASDSIHSAIKQGIITPDEAHITVKVEPYAFRITIEDNGIGIPAVETERVLKDIANSEKSGSDSQAGYFGIGRLSGGGYCKKLKFETSFKGEPTKSILVFDVESIREIINDKNDSRDAATIIDHCTQFWNDTPEEADKNYFKVTLEDVLPAYAPNILDEKKVSDYLKEVAPLSFTASYKTILDNEIELPENNAVKQYYDQLSTIKLTVNDTLDIRKKYSKKIQGTENDKVERIRFFLLSDTDYGDLAWGWIAVTPFSTQINETEGGSTMGIRLRMFNIMIGTRNYFDGKRFFSEPRGNSYFTGEIHIIHNQIKPTPQRDDLAPSTAKIRLDEKIHDLFESELEHLYKEASTMKTALKNFKNGSKDFQYLKSIYDKENLERGFKNTPGYKYLWNIYKPSFEEIIKKNTPQQSETPVDVPTTTNTPQSDSTESKEDKTQTSTQEDSTTTVAQNDNNGQTTETPQVNVPTSNAPKPTSKIFEKLEKNLGSDKKDVVAEIIDIIDKNFSATRKKETVAKTAKRIKDLIIKELGRKK